MMAGLIGAAAGTEGEPTPVISRLSPRPLAERHTRSPWCTSMATSSRAAGAMVMATATSPAATVAAPVNMTLP